MLFDIKKRVRHRKTTYKSLGWECREASREEDGTQRVPGETASTTSIFLVPEKPPKTQQTEMNDKRNKVLNIICSLLAVSCYP